MNLLSYVCHAAARWVFLFASVVVFVGCTTSATSVPDSAPPIFVEEKFPYHLAFIPSEPLETRSCSYTTPLQDKYVYDCGKALYKASMATLEKLFLKVDAYSNREGLGDEIDQIINFEVKDFDILYSHWSWSGDHAVRLEFRYEITDKSGVSRFASTITVEERFNSAQYNANYMLAYNAESSTQGNATDRELMAGVYATSGPEFERLIKEAIQKAMITMADEIVEAGKSGRL